MGEAPFSLVGFDLDLMTDDGTPPVCFRARAETERTRE